MARSTNSDLPSSFLPPWLLTFLFITTPILIVLLARDSDPPTSPDPTLTVSRVIDGDTLTLASCPPPPPPPPHDDRNSCHVRLIGVNTSELPSSPNFDPLHDNPAAAQAAAELVTNLIDSQPVTLVNPPDVDDTDRYGRLLRYVTLPDGRDLGLALICAGLAEPRYDSTDGYDRHPNQTVYRDVFARRNLGLCLPPITTSTSTQDDQP